MQAQVALRYAEEELFNVHLYRWLSEWVRDSNLQKVLAHFAEEEGKHYDFWKKWSAEPVRYSVWRLRWYQFWAWILGPTFILRLLERREHKTIAEYRRIAVTLPEPDRERLLSLISEEETHESELLAAVGAQEPRLKYIGFIVLGLSDAIIEVTGVHAGFLGVSHRPLVAGIAGLIVGFSASISMASAAYLQAKQSTGVSPVRSAAYTGIAYVLAVIVLALPYFLYGSMGGAFWSSVVLAVLLIAAFVYYSSVLSERSFRREVLESLVVLGATTVLSFLFGEGLRRLFPDLEF